MGSSLRKVRLADGLARHEHLTLAEEGLGTVLAPSIRPTSDAASRVAVQPPLRKVRLADRRDWQPCFVRHTIRPVAQSSAGILQEFGKELHLHVPSCHFESEAPGCSQAHAKASSTWTPHHDVFFSTRGLSYSLQPGQSKPQNTSKAKHAIHFSQAKVSSTRTTHHEVPPSTCSLSCCLDDRSLTLGGPSLV